MSKIALLFAIVLLPVLCMANISHFTPPLAPVSKKLKQHSMGTPVYLQIFKEERILELYGKIGNQYRLLDSYRICNFSGGLGPKQYQGDYKSPEGFYTITQSQLKPNSRFYRAINIGFPNEYDRQHRYNGAYLMIHGACVSTGCYAMTNTSIDEIFAYVKAALHNGQSVIKLSIFPFRMTESNMLRHRYSHHISFWQQLQPVYRWFVEHQQPPDIRIDKGNYVLNQPPATVPLLTTSASSYSFSQRK